MSLTVFKQNMANNYLEHCIRDTCAEVYQTHLELKKIDE